MSVSMYSASVPVLVRMLEAMLGWLDKAEQHAQARKFDSANFLQLRLAPDMLPFGRQIQIASDTAKGCAARLAGVEAPKWEDTESSFEELRARIRKTVDFVQSVPRSAVEASAEREIVITLRSGERRFDGQRYLEHWALPNFYFHCTTAYALLRHAGVELGKADFLR